MRKIIVAIGLAVAMIPPAFAAAPPERGNCLSLLASNASGDTVSQAVHEAQAQAAAQGIPFGQRIAQLARTEGTVDECLAILFQGE